MAKIFNWLLFSTSLLIIATYGGCEAQPANTAPQAWNAEQAAQDIAEEIQTSLADVNIYFGRPD